MYLESSLTCSSTVALELVFIFLHLLSETRSHPHHECWLWMPGYRMPGYRRHLLMTDCQAESNPSLHLILETLPLLLAVLPSFEMVKWLEWHSCWLTFALVAVWLMLYNPERLLNSLSPYSVPEQSLASYWYSICFLACSCSNNLVICGSACHSSNICLPFVQTTFWKLPAYLCLFLLMLSLSLFASWAV